MALTKPQIIFLKRAQRQAGLPDEEYREALRTLAGGVASSTDSRVTDEHWDRLLSYFEAIFWRQVDEGKLPAPKSRDVFFERGYWARKNNAVSNSRDRHAASELCQEIDGLEAEMARRGKKPGYCATIRERVCGGAPKDVASMRAYIAALRRTLEAKPKAVGRGKSYFNHFHNRIP